MNDEPPVFKGEYNELSMNEFSALEPPQDSVPVFEVTVCDPDEVDTIELSIRWVDEQCANFHVHISKL